MELGLGMSDRKDLCAEELANDPCWQLVERICATEPFVRSPRFCDLLRYLVKEALQGHRSELNETRIGHAVFDKAADYSPTEDSTVRVHVRQLRLKLHEYFDTVGREETISLEIPKGGFSPVFHKKEHVVLAVQPADLSVTGPSATRTSTRGPWVVPFLLLSLLLLGALSALLLIRLESAPTVTSVTVPWPLSALVSPSVATTIVTADVNTAMLDLRLQHRRSLQEYLSSGTPQDVGLNVSDSGERALLQYLGLTSSADATIAATLANVFGTFHGQVTIRSARDLRPRDFDSGNFIILGSFTSNPWASEFQNQLNFEETGDSFHGPSPIWKNKAPRPGEQPSYACMNSTGSTGTDYADIALVPGHSNHDAVLLLQGCQQEGTESTLAFLVQESGRRDLLKALGLEKPPSTPIYFEALIKTEVIAGAPRTATVVATRLIHPES
jgi:hypothetical protein